MRVTKALVFLAPGLIAYSIVNILARAFYALGDTATPTRISICCLVLNLVLTGLFLGPLEQAGMGLANSMTAAMNAALLLFALHKKLGRLDFHRLQASVLWLAGVAVVSGIAAWVVYRAWESRLGHALFWAKAGGVFVPAAAAGSVYLGLIRLFHIGYGSEAIDQAMASLRLRLRR